MSDVAPGGDQPYGQQPYGEVSYGEPPRNANRGLRALVLSLVLAVVVAGSAVAFYEADPFHLFRAGPQAAVAVPSNALFYAGVDLNPAAKQKIDAVRFLNHFPGFSDSVGSLDEDADLRRVVFSKVIEANPCPGLTFDHDIKPWMGDKIGVAGMPPTQAGGDPVAVIDIQIINEQAAKDGLHALQRCSSGTSFGFAFVGNYVLLAETQAQATRYAAAADKKALSDNPAYSADIRSLGDLGVASAWVDLKALLRDVSTPGSSDLDTASLLSGDSLRIAATFRFDGGAAELAANVYGGKQISHDTNQVVDLPDSTVLAISEAGGAQRVAANWPGILKQLRASNGAVDRQLQEFQTQTGLALPADLETVLGKNFMFAVDSRNLSAGLLNGTATDQPMLGLRFTNDPAQLNQVYDKVIQLLQGSLGTSLPLVKRDFPDGIALATTADYADQLGKLDGRLGEDGDFTSVLPNAGQDEFVAYFDFNAIEGLIQQELQSSGSDAGVMTNLRPLRAIGLAESVTGNYTNLTLRVSVD